MLTSAAAQPPFSAVSGVAHAAQVPGLARAEMAPLAREELARFLALVESLSPRDWSKPTDCTAWDVHAVVAHQASHMKAGASVGEFLDQFMSPRLLRYIAQGMNPLDASNQRQVDLRKDRTPAELIAEIHTYGEPSIQKRSRFPFALRMLRVPVPGHAEQISIGELLDHIFTRDMWMHRIDIARACGHDFVSSAGHDGRIMALIMRDLNRTLARALDGKAILYRLGGTAGGSWRLGGAAEPQAALTMDVIEFNRLASGRLPPAQALAAGLVEIEGDASLANQGLNLTSVIY